MHHNNFGNFYTREIHAIPIHMGFPWEWDSHGVSHSHAHLYTASSCRFDIQWRQQIITAVPTTTWLFASQPVSRRPHTTDYRPPSITTAHCH